MFHKHQQDVLSLIVAKDETDSEILHFMRCAKESRESGFAHVICLLGGFDSDPRQLADIPAARVTAGRLVDSGFISYLDVTTREEFGAPKELNDCLGAMEVWALATGNAVMTKELAGEFEKILQAANGKADSRLGPLLVNQENGKGTR